MLKNKAVIGILIAAGITCLASLAYLQYMRRQASSLEEECKVALNASQWERLEQVATEWAKWEPTKALPWIYAAEAASNQGKLLETGIYLSMLPDDDERTPQALLELSHLQFWDFNQPLAAADTYRRILRIPAKSEPNKVCRREAHRRLIFYYAMARERDLMIEEARRAIAAGDDVPETYIYLLGADWMTFTNGAATNERWLQTNPGHEVYVVARAFHLVRTSALAQEEDSENIGLMERNMSLMAEMLKDYPNNKEILAYHVTQANLASDQQRAVALLQNAPPSTAEDSRFWRAKGTIHAIRQESEEAEAALLKALELHPFDWRARYELAAVYRLQGKLEQAGTYQTASMLGKELNREILRLPSTSKVSTDILKRISDYAESCGEEQIAAQLRDRVAQKANDAK